MLLQMALSHSFSWLSNITHTHTLFIHSSADGHIGCFHVLTIVNSVALNTGAHVLRYRIYLNG